MQQTAFMDFPLKRKLLSEADRAELLLLYLLYLLFCGLRPAARRIVSSWWYRFRHAIENTPTALVVISQTSCVRSCASLSLEMKNNSLAWSCATKAFETTPALKVDSPKPSAETRLILVSKLGQQLESDDAPLTHSLLFCGSGLEINQRKPIAWASKAKFRIHATTA